jgi:hypothetical protein
VPVTVLVELAEPELEPGRLLLSEPVSPLDLVPEVPPEMVVVGVLVAPRCEASKPKSSTSAETVLSAQ